MLETDKTFGTAEIEWIYFIFEKYMNFGRSGTTCYGLNKYDPKTQMLIPKTHYDSMKRWKT
jgi:hypothetical protein